MLALPQEARERQQRRWGWAAAPVLGAHPQEASRLPITLPAPPPGQSGPYAPCLCGGGPKAHALTCSLHTCTLCWFQGGPGQLWEIPACPCEGSDGPCGATPG